MKITDVDVHILNELREDARLSMRELSKRVNLSAPAVAERVRKTGGCRDYRRVFCSSQL